MVRYPIEHIIIFHESTKRSYFISRNKKPLDWVEELLIGGFGGRFSFYIMPALNKIKPVKDCLLTIIFKLKETVVN